MYIQIVDIIYGQEDRGGKAAAIRNNLPQVISDRAFEENSNSYVKYIHRKDSNGNWRVTWQVEEIKKLRSDCGLKISTNCDSITFYPGFDKLGVPSRSHQPPITKMIPNDGWCQIRWNIRYVFSSSISYKQRSINITKMKTEKLFVQDCVWIIDVLEDLF